MKLRTSEIGKKYSSIAPQLFSISVKQLAKIKLNHQNQTIERNNHELIIKKIISLFIIILYDEEPHSSTLLRAEQMKKKEVQKTSKIVRQEPNSKFMMEELQTKFSLLNPGPEKKPKAEASQKPEVKAPQPEQKKEGKSKAPIPRTYTEEEAALEELYKKMLEQSEREEMEKKKQEEERKQEEEDKLDAEKVDSDSSELEEEEAETENFNRAIEIIKGRSVNPRRMAVIVDRLTKDEEIKNLLLQREEKDIGNHMTVDEAIKTFFNSSDYPEFSKAELGDSKFTQIIEQKLFDAEKDENKDLILDKQNSEDKDWFAAPSKPIPGRPSALSRYRAQLVAAGKIKTYNIKKKLELFDVKIMEIIEQIDALTLCPEEMEEFNGPSERLGKLREKVRAMEYLMRERNKALKIANAEQETIKERAIQTARNLPVSEKVVIPSQLSYRPEAVTHRSKRRARYRVNMNILNQRKNMSELQRMERRYIFMGKT